MILWLARWDPVPGAQRLSRGAGRRRAPPPGVSGARLWTRFLGRDGQVPLTPGVTHCVLPLSGRIGKKCSGVLGVQSRAALVFCLETLALMVGE
jgi:hypothetical protein